MKESEFKMIRAIKSEFNNEFIRKFDEEWQEVLQLFRGCKKDLSKIPIVAKKAVGSSRVE